MVATDRIGATELVHGTAEYFLEPVPVVSQAFGLRLKEFPSLGEAHAFLGAVEELHSERVFQAAQSHSECRLGNAEALGRAGKVLGSGGFEEVSNFLRA